MKRNFLLLIAILFSTNMQLFAQDYKLTFALQGEANTIDSVIVENATKNTSIKLNGNDTLVLTKLVNANRTALPTKSFQLKVFPNPSGSFFNLQFKTNKPEEIFASVFDLSGRVLVTEKWFLNQGNHSFQLKNLPEGIFLIQINSANFSEKIKIISLQNSHVLPEISAVYSESKTDIFLPTKSATSAQLLGYEQYDNITVRVWPTSLPTSRGFITTGFVMDEENPPLENEENTFVFEYVACKDICENEYNTVKIGNQVWMAENFRCPTENSWLYNDDDNNEELYGRLYTWKDALDNAPEGWHLPSNEDWLELEEHINTLYGNKVPLALKSKTDWLPDEFQNSTNGNNASGFNMYPGGARWYLDGSFYAAGDRAYFWTSTKYDSIRARIRKFTSSDTQIADGASNIDYGFSVRYVKDKHDFGILTDERDGQSYKTIKIGEQTWMAENLRFTDESGYKWKPVTDNNDWNDLGWYKSAYCWYQNDESNKYTYGALYNFQLAVKRDLCPFGWHVPSDQEWTILSDFLKNNGYGFNGNENYIGKPLASATGWKPSNSYGDVGKNPDSNNSTGFSGLAGGHRGIWGEFNGQGYRGKWWSTTEYDTGLPLDREVWIRELNCSSHLLLRKSGEVEDGCSVRCVKD